jgi:hypothetical protein
MFGGESMADGEFDNLTVNNTLTIGADTNLYRSAANTLTLNSALAISGNGPSLDLANTGAGSNTFHLDVGSSTGNFFIYPDSNQYLYFQNAARNNRMILDFNTGQLALPVTGSSAGLSIGGDCTLYRGTIGLQTDNSFWVKKDGYGFVQDIQSSQRGILQLYSLHENPYFRIEVSDRSTYWKVFDFLSTGDFRIYDGKLQFFTDTNLYRSTDNTLKTDDAFTAAGNIICGNPASGYYGARLVSTGYMELWSSFSGLPYIDMKDDYTTDFDVRIQKSATHDLQLRVGGHSAQLLAATLKATGQFQLPVQGSNGGLLIGGDTNLYRSDTTTLTTNADFECSALNVNDGLTANEKLLLPCSDAPQPTNLEMINAVYGWTTSYLTSNAAADQKYVTVANGSLFAVNDWVAIRDNNNWEKRQVVSKNGNTLELNNDLNYTYYEAANAAVDKWVPDGFTLPDNTLQLGNEANDNNSYLFILRDPTTTLPLLTTDEGMLVKKDVSAGGYLGSNQGAVMLGHGLMHAGDPPKISLTHSDLMFESEATFPTEGLYDGRFFYLTEQSGGYSPGYYYYDASASTWVSAEDSSFPNDPAKWQLFVRTDYNPHILYQYNDATCDPPEQWVNLGSMQNWEGNFDTLHIVRLDGTTPANMDLGDVTAHGTVKVDNLDPIPAGLGGNGTWIDVNTKLKIHGDLQLVDGHVVSSLNPSGSISLGSPEEAWTGVVCETLYYVSADQYPWDEHDDLKLVQGYTTTKNDAGKTVIDKNSLAFLLADKNKKIGFTSDNRKKFFDANKVNAFTLGCLKQTANKFDDLYALIATMSSEIQALKEKINLKN